MTSEHIYPGNFTRKLDCTSQTMLHTQHDGVSFDIMTHYYRQKNSLNQKFFSSWRKVMELCSFLSQWEVYSIEQKRREKGVYRIFNLLTAVKVAKKVNKILDETVYHKTA